MSELRWNPMLEEWVIVATHRQDRTYLPKTTECPLCPGVLEIPENFEIACFENRFPSLRKDPEEPEIEGDELYRVRKAQGICEVVVYTPEHEGTLTDQSVQKIYNLVRVWKDRYEELGSRDFIDYVFIFENKGEVIGVTLHHPHGQIYAYPFIPPKIRTELNASLKYYNKHNGQCLFCEILRKEREYQKRIVAENKSFTAFIPFFARYTYEVHIYPNQHLRSIAEFDDTTQQDLAKILKNVLLKYDNLFNFSFPYIMVMHQEPTTGERYDHYHFHIEFYPPYRTKEKIKYLAGSESGAGTFINDAAAEEKAKELRDSYPHWD